MRVLTFHLLRCIRCGSENLSLFQKGGEEVRLEGIEAPYREFEEGAVICEDCSFYYTIGVVAPGILDASPIYFRDPGREIQVLSKWGIDTTFLRSDMPELGQRDRWLLSQIKEAMKAYETPGECWSVDELDMMPYFLRILREGGVTLDLAGGYGRCTPHLLEKAGFVVLADLSAKELEVGRNLLSILKNVDFVRLDMLNPPFRKGTFDGIWFTQAFEYVPPDKLEGFISEMSRMLKPGGVFFGNMEGQPIWRLLKAYLRLRLRGNPARLGEYIYEINGLRHYHSVPALSRSKVEKLFGKYGLTIVCRRNYKEQASYPLVYLLQRQGSCSPPHT